MANEGPSVATDVHVTFEPPLQGTGDSTYLDQVQERLRSGLGSLAPGRRLQWTVDVAHRVFSEGLPLVYAVSITGEGPVGTMERLTYVVDLNDLRNAADSPSGSSTASPSDCRNSPMSSPTRKGLLQHHEQRHS